MTLVAKHGQGADDEARVQLRLRESAGRLEEAQRIARIGDFVWDLGTDELTWSDSLFDLVQYDPADGIDTDTFNNHVIHPRDRDLVARWLRDAVASGVRRVPPRRYRLIRRDGKILYVQTEAVVERPPDASPLVFGTVQDISAQHAAESALQESERRFRLAFDQQFQFMAILSAEGRVLEVNDLPLRVQGVTRDAYVGELFWEAPAWRDLPEWRAIIESRIAEAKSRTSPLLAEDAYRAADGEVRWATAAYTAVRDADGVIELILVQATDITDRKRFEEQLRERERQLRALSARMQSVREEQSQRISRELHDQLGQALTALRFDLSTLADRLAADDAATELPSLVEQTHDIKAFVDTTLASVRRIATELRPRVLDDAGLFAALEWQAREFEHHTGIATRLAREETAPEPDPERATAIFRCFQELLTNVARHAEATRVRATLRHSEGAFELTVRDDGIGLRREELNRPDALGLIGVRERALGFGGDLHLASRPGEGTTVTVRVPSSAPER